MPDYRRNNHPGATFFFTVVTHERRPVLTTDLGRYCLRQALLGVKAQRPFDHVAVVLLPDHLHAIWTLHSGDSDYSIRWAQIKERFTRLFLDGGGEEGAGSASRTRHRERGVWQRRFWEHTCRDEDDLKRCVDYLHWNPVKHGLVRFVEEYPWSSFHRFVRAGEYEHRWGESDPCRDWPEAEGE
jgi:putative transposase